MKRIAILTFSLLGIIAISCNKEQSATEDVAVSGKTLKAVFFDETKTAFVTGTYMWKTNDNIVVRSDNAKGYTTFKYTGSDTAGEVEFVPNTDDNITYGNNSFAIYPAKTSGTGAEAYPKEEGGSLKVVLKDTYTWFDGNVEAPMLAKVTDAATPLEFKHLGGVLKVTYKNVPPKAAKVVVTAPIDPSYPHAGKSSYKICSTMSKTYNWTTAGGGFGAEIPYVQAYAHESTYSVAINITSATAAQRASDEGITVYIPLPVGPELSGTSHIYPKLNVKMIFADETTVPGTERNATNVQIERAHIKPMPEIVLTKYSVEVVAGTNGSSGTTDGTGTAAKFNQVRGLCWLDNTNLLLTESNGDKVLRKFNKTTKDVSSAKTLGGSAPWQGTTHNGNLYFADKGNNKVRSWNSSTDAVADVITSGLDNPMDIAFNGDDAYVVCRNGSKIIKYAGGFANAGTTFFDFSTLEHGTNVLWPLCVTFDNEGNVIVPVSYSSGTHTSAFKIYIIKSDGTVLTTIGAGTKGASFAGLVDGAADKAVFSANMSGITFGPDGALYMVDGWSVRRITKGSSGWNDAVVTTILGGGSSYTSSVGATCQLTSQPQDIVFDPENDKVFYFFDFYSTSSPAVHTAYTLRKVTIE